MADVESNYPPKTYGTRNGATDTFGGAAAELDSPASFAFPITPTNSEGLKTSIRGLYIGTTGNVFCRVQGGNVTHSEANVFFYNVQAGTVLPVRMDGVWTYNEAEGDSSQNTTSTFLVGLY